jgi:hypothetical protein
VSEWRLFPEGTVPWFTTQEFYDSRVRAPHLEQSDHRPRLLAAAEHVAAAIAADPLIISVSDLGCGDGGLLSILPPGLKAWGYDTSPAQAGPAVSERGVDVRLSDVVAGEPEWGDLAVATEMLEHLLDPHAFVRRVFDAGCRALVASSPASETGRSHYEFHAWAWDQDGYRALLEQGGWQVAWHRTAGSYQLITGVRP